MLFVFVSFSARKRPGLTSRARLSRLFELIFLSPMITTNQQGGQGFSSALTPASNTGSNSQTLQSPDLTVKVDWLQLSTLHPSTEDFKQMLKYLEDMFDDQITWHSDTPLFRGRKWDSSGNSVRGLQVCFDFPGEVEPGRGWVCLPGSLLAQVDARAVYDLCCMMTAAWSAVSRRIDVAIDDFSKPFQFREIYDLARAGNVAHVRSTSIRYSASAKNKDGLEGESVILGSAQSDKRITFYNKAVESDGAVESHRVEVRLRDYKADQVFQKLATLTPDQFESEGAQFLAGVVIGAIDFLDRSSGDRNLDRMPRLSWWAEFCDRVGSARLKLASKRPVHSMDRKVAWLVRDVGPSLAVIQRVLTERDFRDFIETLLDSGKARLGEAHEKIIRVFRFDWYEGATYGGSIHEQAVA